jgi:ArsR family transcriptional regulator
MQIADPTPEPPTTPDVLDHSLLLDLTWCVHAASSEYLRANHPILERLYEDHGDLPRRLSDLWPDDVTCTVEAEVMAFHGGVLGAGDFATYREGCEAAIGTVPVEPALASETDEIRRSTWQRLRRLRDSEELRDRYFAIQAEIWEFVDPWWQRVGRPAAERSAVDVRKAIAKGAEWPGIISADCPTFTDHLPDILEKQHSGHRVVIAPCALFGRGLYLDLPDCTVVGMGATDRVLAARAETEEVAGTLRALADPTRLAIFHSLRSGPTTVGDIARSFSLSQPTVSMHVKRLREAGLVDSTRHGNRMEITINEPRSDLLAARLTALLAT